MQKTFDVLKQQRVYSDELDDVITNQLKIEQRVKQEFDSFMLTVEEFRGTMVQKV